MTTKNELFSNIGYAGTTKPHRAAMNLGVAIIYAIDIGSDQQVP